MLSRRISAVRAMIGMVTVMTWVVMFHGSQLELEEDQPDEERVDAEEQDFHGSGLSFGRRVPASGSSSRRARAAASARAPRRRPQPVGGVPVAVLDLVGAVGHLVEDRLRVGPEPGQRPEHAAEEERQQAERLDRLGLRMVALLGDLLGQDVDQPEDRDGDRPGTMTSTTQARTLAIASRVSPSKIEARASRGARSARRTRIQGQPPGLDFMTWVLLSAPRPAPAGATPPPWRARIRP